MTLETPRLLLRPFRDEDAPALYDYARDPRVGPPAGWKPHESEAERLRIIRTVFAAPHTFALVEKESGRVIGPAGFTGRTRGGAERSDELGYALRHDRWGRGLMTEACRRLIVYGFEEMDLAAIWCTHYDGNDRSRRVIEKCGFRPAFSERLRDEFGEHLVFFYFLLRERGEAF